MNFRQDVTAVTVVYWRQRLGLFEHQLASFDKYGRPDNYIIWVNTTDLDVLGTAVDYAETHPGTYIVESGNIHDLPAYDAAADMVDTPYMLSLGQDACIRNYDWMERFEAIAPFDMAGVEGEDARALEQFFNYPSFHVRGGMNVVNVESFKAAGRNLYEMPAPGCVIGETPWPVIEVGLTVKMRKLGMEVKALDPYPMYDYDHWGERILRGTREFSNEELNRFDEAIHIERALTATWPNDFGFLFGYDRNDRTIVHIIEPFSFEKEGWDWIPMCSPSSEPLISAPAGHQIENVAICSECLQISKEEKWVSG